MDPLSVPLEIGPRQETPTDVDNSRTFPLPIEDSKSKVEKSVHFTLDRYAQRVYFHWRSSIATSLYAGGDFTSLKDFLRFHHLKPEAIVPPSPFAYLYKLDAKNNLEATRLEWHQTEEETKPGTNCLLFLTGYPSAQWLNKLGDRYEIDPEFYRRHLSYMQPSFFPSVEVAGHLPSLVLPSSTSTIIQLTCVSIGTEDNRSYIGLAKNQKQADKEMRQYFRDLSNLENYGRLWKPEDSVVRSYCVHSQNTFSLEQRITIHAKKLDTGYWILIVWLDSGKELASSPPGPWSALNGESHRHHFHPNSMYKPGIALTGHRVVDKSRDLNIEPLEQSVRLLPRFYGRSLKIGGMASDPFYALNEVFTFVVSSELSFLRTISSDLDIEFEEAEEKLGQGCCVVTLMHYQQLLERQIHRTEETLNFIENRHKLGWPKLENPKLENPGDIAVGAEAKLKLDFDYLLREGRRQKKRCKRRLENQNSQNIQAPSTEFERSCSNRYTWSFVGGISMVIIASFSLKVLGVPRYLQRP
ncbi:uncharacterized protein PAC_01363 [Phialocephala subalpina]|uniref:Uncharacterized protein n=1 Tax=Phialocephala subalpina TaxID=576137 RepID=A0A1L7WFC9_9HELO|nr:uncharacterized protein PAC_01363 [Phialocephala subalpina]